MKKTSKILLLVIVTMFMSFMLFSNSVFADTDLVTASTGDDDVVDLDSVDTEDETPTKEKNETANKVENKTNTTTNEAKEKVPQTGSFTTATYITIGGVAVLALTIAATRIKKYNF